MTKELTTDQRLDKINNNLEKVVKIVASHDEQLTKIATIVVKGFDHIDKSMETKAATKD